MDVALLSISIKEIILEKDSVGVPGVGTFIAELVPSTFSDKGYTINPPYRRLSFTRKATEDGLLAERMKEKYGITGKQLTDFLEKLKGILTERKSVELPGLGRLRSTRENHFFFVPDEDLDIWPAGFGLVSISLKNNQGFDEEISPRAPSELGRNDRESAPSPVISSETSPVISSDPSPVISSAVETRACERWPQPKSPEKPAQKPRTLLIIIIVFAALAALGLLALAILGRVAPDAVDRLLYSPQELQTLKSLNL